MLTPEQIQRIRKVHIKCGRLVNTMMAGHYRSVFRGSGIEFEEVREYTPGDEVKSIDWKVSARMGRPFVKRFREERELLVMLLVDMSASMRFGTTGRTKNELAAEIAGIMAFNAIRSNDKIGAIFFTDQVEHYIPPGKGAGHVWRVIRALYEYRPANQGTDMRIALKFMGQVCRKRAVALLISDFLDQDYLKPLKTMARKHELITVLLSDQGDFEMPAAGIMLAEDFETGERLWLDVSDPRTRKAYHAARRGVYEKSLSALKMADIDCIALNTQAEPVDELTRYFRMRERRLR